MINVDEIEERLNKLKSLYQLADDNELPLLYSKIAVIELGGWIEENRDNIARDLINRLFSESDDDLFEKYFGKNNKISGFNYESHFVERVFKQLIGIHGWKTIENNVDIHVLCAFKSSLGTLWNQRNRCAHRTVTGTTETIPAPSTTINNFHNIKEGLAAFESAFDLLPHRPVSVITSTNVENT